MLSNTCIFCDLKVITLLNMKCFCGGHKRKKKKQKIKKRKKNRLDPEMEDEVMEDTLQRLCDILRFFVICKYSKESYIELETQTRLSENNHKLKCHSCTGGTLHGQRLQIILEKS